MYHQYPTTINDFEILQKLGEGSFSQVFKVIRIEDQKIYAMKKVKMGSLTVKERENALNEVRILASLDDKHIIGYKDAFFEEQGSLLYIIMEYASGGDIQKQIIENVQFKTSYNESEIWKALIQMTLGLRVLHKNQILHRDLKCANIFKAQDGTYKIGDLNVSKVTKGILAITQTGTPYYASPEVWRDQPYSSSTDIWSLGCIIYEMTALQPPFRAANLVSLSRRVQSGIYDQIPKNYSKKLNMLLSQLLKINPKLRPTCDEILNNEIVKMHSGGLIQPQKQLEEKFLKKELLDTIKLPLNLNLSKIILPQSNYGTIIKEVLPIIRSMREIKLPKQSKQPKSSRNFSGRTSTLNLKCPINSHKEIKLPSINQIDVRDIQKRDAMLPQQNYFVNQVPSGLKHGLRPSMNSSKLIQMPNILSPNNQSQSNKLRSASEQKLQQLMNR